jgi:hypothetical protein
MRLFHAILGVLVIVSAVDLSWAQPPQSHDWVPKGVEALRTHASTKTEFTLDHSMLVLASKMDPDNADLKRVIAGVDGVTVRSYRYPAPSTYDPATLAVVKAQFHEAGWKQLMNKEEKDGGSGVTDVWVRLENNAVSNISILQAKSNEVNFVVVSGSINPLDLFRLGGHFGIPKIDGGVTVPNTKERP